MDTERKVRKSPYETPQKHFEGFVSWFALVANSPGSGNKSRLQHVDFWGKPVQFYVDMENVTLEGISSCASVEEESREYRRRIERARREARLKAAIPPKKGEEPQFVEIPDFEALAKFLRENGITADPEEALSSAGQQIAKAKPVYSGDLPVGFRMNYHC